MRRLTAIALLLSVALPLLASDARIGLTADAVLWKATTPPMPEGTRMAVLEGNPRAEGMFTIRLRIPAGSSLPPHWHSEPERATVLSGLVEIGFGTTVDRTRTKRFGIGSFYVTPSRSMHYLYFPEETVLQITGMGPWELEMGKIPPYKPSWARATVTVRRATPAERTSLQNAKKLQVVVDYTLDRFRPNVYALSIHFESKTPGRTFAAPYIVGVAAGAAPPSPPSPTILTTKSGSATVTAELEHVLTFGELKRPIRARVIVEEMSAGESRIVGLSDWIEYQ